MHPSWRCLLLGTNVALVAGDGANKPPQCASMRSLPLSPLNCSVGFTSGARAVLWAVGNTAFLRCIQVFFGGGLVPAWENYGDRDVGIV